MATITAKPSFDQLTINKTNQKTGSITWTAPTIPSGAVISSCVLSGTLVIYMSSGSGTVTINGTARTAGAFSIDLGTSNTTTSVVVTAKGDDKRAKGTVSINNLSYTVTYEIPNYTVRFLDWNNNVLDTQTINHGSNAIPPNNPIRDGYRFTGWSGTYTNITANTDIIAQYIKTYNIVASAGTGGTISPSGTITVDEGVSQSYTISVNTEYRIKDVLVDGVSQGAIVSYTFSNVSADHTISVNFEAVPTYTITTNVGEGGSISPSGNIILTEGDSQTFTFIPDSGYGIKDVLVDDISQGEITSYTFTDVTANHTLSVIFKEIPRVIAAIKKNVFYAINIFEGYNNFSIGADGVYLNTIHEDLNENENIYLDSNGILHVYKFIKGNL